MSGCFPVEPLSYCEHGINKLLKCEVCKLQININDIIKVITKGDLQLENDIIRILQKIEKLEKECKRLSDQCKIHWNREDTLFECFHKIESKIEALTQKSSLNCEKHPYKCPVCNGAGQWELESIESVIANGGSKNKDCHACDGKGIVWG